MIKAIFFDIDGTLVSFKTHTVPQSTIHALSLLKEKGIKTFIATGRHRRDITNIGTLTFDGYVTLNGSCCINERNEIIYKHRIPSEDIEALLDYLDGDDRFPCIFVQEKSLLINYRDKAVKDSFVLLNLPGPPNGNLRDVPTDDVYQLIAFFEPHREEKIMTVLPGCESARWTPLFTDIVPRGSSKREGIDHMLENYGIALEETMAFGDGGNDISMIEHAAIGIAMGNAEETVKQIADYVTDSVDENGIYNALVHFGII